VAVRSTSGAVLGVDGARGGWVGVRWDGSTLSCHLAPTLAGLVGDAGPVALVAVDMPIALVEHGTRAAEDEVRRLLGPRRSSLFQSPCLGALDFADDDYPGANAWSKATVGRGLSKQAWFLVPKIREVRALAEASAVPVREAMPELSFAAMHGDVPLPHTKVTWSGHALRRRLLADHGIDLPDDPGPAGQVAPDDLLDAAAVAWTARRIVAGEARRAPADGDPAAAIWW
jgi:predicted RNase H-like nuclease